jgi:hypothetical protein
MFPVKMPVGIEQEFQQLSFLLRAYLPPPKSNRKNSEILSHSQKD